MNSRMLLMPAALSHKCMKSLETQSASLCSTWDNHKKPAVSGVCEGLHHVHRFVDLLAEQLRVLPQVKGNSRLVEKEMPPLSVASAEVVDLVLWRRLRRLLDVSMEADTDLIPACCVWGVGNCMGTFVLTGCADASSNIARWC